MGIIRSLAALCLAGAGCAALGGVSGNEQRDVLAQRTGFGLAGVNASSSVKAPVSGGLNGRMNVVQEDQKQLQAGFKHHPWHWKDESKEWRKAGDKTREDWVRAGQKTLDALDLAGKEVLERRHNPKIHQKWLENMLKNHQVSATDLDALFPPNKN